MTFDVQASTFPSVFKEGWLRVNKKIPFLRAQPGWLVNSIKIRCAARASTRVLRDLLLTTPPSIEASPYRAALRGVLTVGSLGHPSLKTEGNENLCRPSFPLILEFYFAPTENG